MVLIQVDPGNAEQVGFWRKRNPEALAVVEVMELQPGDAATAFICQVSILRQFENLIPPFSLLLGCGMNIPVWTTCVL
jgi:hypothetical protein